MSAHERHLCAGGLRTDHVTAECGHAIPVACSLPRSGFLKMTPPIMGGVGVLVRLHIKGRVHKIHILPIKLLSQNFYGFSKSLEMDDLPLPEESDDVVDIGIITDAQNVVIGYASFLF